jgi:outer membrane receptor for ferric coprogen and ferric-rhodotorulic acid
MKTRLYSLGSALVICLAAQAAWAHGAPELYTGDAEAAVDGAQDEIIVNGKTFSQGSSALGLGVSIIETPRSVVSVDATKLKDLSIDSVRDFAKLAPSAYTTTQFGGANTPSLRGQSAEVFQDGILRTPRSNGLPFSFNGVGGLDIVMGPAGVVYGPTGRVGGFVNYISKKPSLDKFHAAAELSYGSWNDKRAQLDVTGPIANNLGIRLSYERVDADSYYRYGFTNSHDIYGALRWEPSAKFSADANIEYYHARFVENTGINRPTQELIDDGLYYTGTGVGAFSSPLAADRRGFRSVINVTGAVKIDRSLQLVAPTDYAKGSDLLAQLHLNYKFNDVLSLANHMAYEDYTQLQAEYAQRYYNYIPRSHNFQDRLELSLDMGKQKVVGGLAYRHIDVLAYGDFFNEYLNATDITTDPSKYVISNLTGVVAVPGRTGEFATPGAAYGVAGYSNAMVGTQKQKSDQVGAFLQAIVHPVDKLSILVGGRADRIHEDLTDPLPPPGVTAVHAAISVWDMAVNTSATYSFTPSASIYATFDYNQSPVTTNGGGFAGFTGRTLLKQNFQIDNYLYEAGGKTSIFNDKLFGSVAVYHQKRSIADTLGNISRVDVKGGEVQLNYQPTKNFSATLGYSYIDAKLPNATQSAFTQNVYDAFAAPYGTGRGSPNFTALPRGTYRLPGVPEHLFTGFVKYTTDFGLGATMNAVVTSPMNTSYLGNVKIRTQYQVDASVFYNLQRWTVYLNLYNITDQKNWSAAGASQGNDLINADLPFHVRGGIRYKF